MHTMMEVQLDIITSDVGSHGNDWRSIELANEMACRHTVEIRHDDVH